MEIKLYKTTSENICLNKELTDEMTLNGNLVNDCDLINPVIIVNFDSNILSRNYASVAAFGRKYFITGFRVINQTIEISLHCDVLATYRDAIRNSRAHIVRSQGGDKYIIDNRATQTNRVAWRCEKLGRAFNSGSTVVLIKGVNG